MRLKKGRSGDGSTSPVVRLVTERASDPDSVFPSGIVHDIEPFLPSMRDSTCYRVAAKREEAFHWMHHHDLSRQMLVMEGIGFSSAWNALLGSIEQRTEESSDGSVLVTLVLCPPSSLVFRELKNTYAYVNLRSGNVWDLYMIGYTAINRYGATRPSVLGIPIWRFSAGRFLDVIAHIQQEHAGALADSDNVTAGKPWRYSGTADLVSFMAYQDSPTFIDWLSLRAVQLLDAKGTYLDRNIGQIVEIMSDWREDGPEVREFAPGELQQTAISILDLRQALIAVAGMVISGVVGNAAYDLLRNLRG
jgi:hypothetical protein